MCYLRNFLIPRVCGVSLFIISLLILISAWPILEVDNNFLYFYNFVFKLNSEKNPKERSKKKQLRLLRACGDKRCCPNYGIQIRWEMEAVSTPSTTKYATIQHPKSILQNHTEAKKVKRIEFIVGKKRAFLLENVLSKEECESYILVCPIFFENFFNSSKGI